MRGPWARVYAFAALLAAGLPGAAYAQKITGDISGTVTDSNGSIVLGANVDAECTTTGLKRASLTDSAGGYRLAEMPICVYKVSAGLQGFKTTSRTVQVAVNALTKADFVLQLGARTEEVTVEGVAPLVEFSDKLNNYVDKERIDNLPLNGRDFNSLLAITPGVQRAPGGGFLAINISGARRTANNFMIDGIPNNDRYYGGTLLNETGVVGIPASLIPMDAIAEFTVQQTPSAEFGVKGGAAVNVVMRSGTNQFHGSTHFYFHDDFADATNYFAKSTGPEGCTGSDCGDRTPLKNKQFGFTFGGPIVKDRTFFFGYYEGQRLSTESPYTAPVPTPSQIAEARQRIAVAGLSTVQAGESLLAFYPTDPSGLAAVSIPSSSDSDSYSVKFDHKLNDNNQLALRVFDAPSFQSAPAFVGTIAPAGDRPADMFNSIADSRVFLTGLTWTSTLASNKIWETRASYSWYKNVIDINNKIDPRSLGIDTGPLEPEDFGVPALYYFSSFGYIGGIGGYPIHTNPTESLDLSSSLTWIKGRHTLKVGGNLARAKNNSLRNRARTVLNVSGGTGDPVDAIVALLLGRFDDASRSFGSTRRHMSMDSLGVFVNDEFKISPRFTLSFGLRYDISSPLKEADNLGSNFLPDQGLVDLGSSGLDQLYESDKNNFGPRLGFAWDLSGNGRTALRAGYALTYDVPNFGSIHAPRTTFSGLGSRAGAFTQKNQDIFSVGSGGDLGTAPDDPSATCVDPVTGEGNFVCVLPGVPIFGRNPQGAPPFDAFAVKSDLQTPSYHFFHATLQHEVFKNNVVTLSYVGSRGRNLLMYRDLNAPPIGSGGTEGERPYFSRFPDLRHIIQLVDDGRSRYSSAQLSWRQRDWHGFNTQYNYTFSRCRDYNSNNRTGRTNFGQFHNPWRPEENEGPCDYDVPHNFNVGATYTIPDFGLGRVGEGWEFGTVFTALSGRPFTANISNRDQSGQSIGSIRADCLAEPQYNYSDPTNFITNSAAAFGTPAAGRGGTCGRNSVRGPGLSQWDLSLLKMTRLGDRVSMQFRWEVFNILNKANFGLPFSTNVRSSAFGTIGSTPDVDAVNPVIAQGGPRSMQFAIKLMF